MYVCVYIYTYTYTYTYIKLPGGLVNQDSRLPLIPNLGWGAYVAAVLARNSVAISLSHSTKIVSTNQHLSLSTMLVYATISIFFS